MLKIMMLTNKQTKKCVTIAPVHSIDFFYSTKKFSFFLFGSFGWSCVCHVGSGRKVAFVYVNKQEIVFCFVAVVDFHIHSLLVERVRRIVNDHFIDGWNFGNIL